MRLAGGHETNQPSEKAADSFGNSDHGADSSRNPLVQANCAFIADQEGKLCRLIGSENVNPSDCSGPRRLIDCSDEDLTRIS